MDKLWFMFIIFLPGLFGGILGHWGLHILSPDKWTIALLFILLNSFLCVFVYNNLKRIRHEKENNPEA